MSTVRTVVSKRFRTLTTGTSKLAISCNSGLDRVFFFNAITLQVAPFFGAGVTPYRVFDTAGSSWRNRFILAGQTVGGAKYYAEPVDNVAEFDGLLLLSSSGNFIDPNAIPNIENEDAFRWVTHYWTKGKNGRGAPTAFWATWPRCPQPADMTINSANEYLAKSRQWPMVQDYCNKRMPFGQEPVRLFPMYEVFNRIRLAINAGTAPGITDYNQLFADNDIFHLSDLGEYINGLFMMVCTTGIDPKLFGKSFNGRVAPQETTQAYICLVIKQVLTDFVRAGVDTSAWS